MSAATAGRPGILVVAGKSPRGERGRTASRYRLKGGNSPRAGAAGRAGVDRRARRREFPARGDRRIERGAGRPRRRVIGFDRWGWRARRSFQDGGGRRFRGVPRAERRSPTPFDFSGSGAEGSIRGGSPDRPESNRTGKGGGAPALRDGGRAGPTVKQKPSAGDASTPSARSAVIDSGAEDSFRGGMPRPLRFESAWGRVPRPLRDGGRIGLPAKPSGQAGYVGRFGCSVIHHSGAGDSVRRGEL